MRSSHSPCIASYSRGSLRSRGSSCGRGSPRGRGSSRRRGSSYGQGSSWGEVTCDGTPETENPWKKVEPNSVCWNYYLIASPKRPFHTNTSPLQLFCRFFTGEV